MKLWDIKRHTEDLSHFSPGLLQRGVALHQPFPLVAAARPFSWKASFSLTVREKSDESQSLNSR
ncbi:hypothetical protein E2C01_077883 [Portunus trituberculatus]|uniref:Uncharacterized protein n=1 Tax=Portunus trituberculatus TaxID=210409 RepID=A0A5B7ILA3_PORTR|nr:hypothetical protein [Portunus trituberculatus]